MTCAPSICTGCTAPVASTKRPARASAYPCGSRRRTVSTSTSPVTDDARPPTPGPRRRPTDASRPLPGARRAPSATSCPASPRERPREAGAGRPPRGTGSPIALATADRAHNASSPEATTGRRLARHRGRAARASPRRASRGRRVTFLIVALGGRRARLRGAVGDHPGRLPRLPPAARARDQDLASARARRVPDRSGFLGQRAGLRGDQGAGVLRLVPHHGAAPRGLRRPEERVARVPARAQRDVRQRELLRLPRQLRDVRHHPDQGRRHAARVAVPHRVPQHVRRRGQEDDPSARARQDERQLHAVPFDRGHPLAEGARPSGDGERHARGSPELRERGLPRPRAPVLPGSGRGSAADDPERRRAIDGWSSRACARSPRSR